MSRAYNMYVTIRGYEKEKEAAIQAAMNQEWDFDDHFDFEEDGQSVMQDGGDGSLGGGEMEEEFTARLCKAIWKANGKFCAITVDATCLEDLPYESHYGDEADYERLMGKKKTTKKAKKGGKR